MLKLYRFFWDAGRQGHVEGVFAEDSETVKKSIGKDVHFGEILGKHSEVQGILEDEDLTILCEDKDFIQKATEYKLIPIGYNPLDYIETE